MWKYILVGAALFLMIAFSYNQISFEKKETYDFVAPSPAIKHLTFGYNETLADSFWIRVIQDFEHCNRDITWKSGEAPKLCSDSWVFRMIDLITELSPKFEVAHQAGAIMLSIIVNDAQGAKVIFDKAVERFPLNWSISYYAAYHYMMELDQPARAAELLVQSAKNGGPQWLYSLAGKMYDKSGQRVLGISILEAALKGDKTKEHRPRIEARLKELREKAKR